MRSPTVHESRNDLSWLFRKPIAKRQPSKPELRSITPNIRIPSDETDVLQISGLLAGDVKESRNGNPTRDLQMAADRTRPHSAAMLADSLAGENPARGTCPVATVVISGDGAGDQSVGSLEVKVPVGWA